MNLIAAKKERNAYRDWFLGNLHSKDTRNRLGNFTPFQRMEKNDGDTEKEVLTSGRAPWESCGKRVRRATVGFRELMVTDKTIKRLAQEAAVGIKPLQEILTHRLACLKPGSARWPKKKYGAVWREARAAYKQAVRDIPFTSQVEQVVLLAKQAYRINEELERGEILTPSLVKTVEGLRKLSVVDEGQIPVNLSTPQLVGVLERLTLVLKAPERKVTGNGPLALPGEAGVASGELE